MSVDLKAIRERAEKATPGPWVSDLDIYSDEGFIEAGVFDGPIQMLFTDSTDIKPTGPHDKAWEEAAKSQRKRDADFIAHAREDIPALLERIGELEEANTRASAELRHAWKGSQLAWANEGCNWRRFDANLVSKAIQILERALSPERMPSDV